MKLDRIGCGWVVAAASAALLVGACKKETEPSTQAESSATAAAPASASASAKAKKAKRDPKEIQERRKALLERLKKKRTEAKPVAKVKPTPDDPEKGEFTLDEATRGLAGKGQLMAEIHTDEGTLSCELYEDKAPITVANFVGLARGLRPYKEGDKWVKKPLYDGTPFHRIIKGFMVQGGDPEGNGTGGPGYVIPDEIWANAKHDERGLLCMANRGPNTSGSQFFILDGKAPHLDGGYTIFGKCSPESVIDEIAAAEVKGDRAVKPPKIKRIVIKRDATKPAPEPAPEPSSAKSGKDRPAKAGSAAQPNTQQPRSAVTPEGAPNNKP